MELIALAAGPFRTNCYIIADESGNATVIDPGMHSAKYVEKSLEERGWTMRHIILTHGHIDHTRDAGTLAQRRDVPVYIHAADAFMLESGKGVTEKVRRAFDGDNMTPIRDRRELVDGMTLDIGGENFVVRHAPGHSPGCVLLVGSEIAFTGDVLFKGTIGRTDLEHSDPEAMKASLAGPVSALEDHLVILPGHGAQTVMQHERERNPYLQPSFLAE